MNILAHGISGGASVLIPPFIWLLFILAVLLIFFGVMK